MTDAQKNAEVFDAIAVKQLIVTSLNTTPSIEVANGANNVTISNVAPAGVGTATISKWLQFTGSDGAVYYIPVWT